MQMPSPLAARVSSRACVSGRVPLGGPLKPRSRRTRMTRSQPRSNKAPPRAKPAMTLPKLGTALNWVPPKAPASEKSRPKKRPPAP
ncbi:hypothetical protein C5615_35000 [Burkholderia cepacia]|uniref:Uncharacterized protein n=1 Tax=Burkholderia cepacia TaxID=292 RepID=A0A2S8I3M6_BURCE|nr:hypothetical protein C5615_35000 [Burkholderia cepacia]